MLDPPVEDQCLAPLRGGPRLVDRGDHGLREWHRAGVGSWQVRVRQRQELFLQPGRASASASDLHEIPAIGLCTMLCGGDDRSDVAVFGGARQSSSGFATAPPSHDTFSRVFRLT